MNRPQASESPSDWKASFHSSQVLLSLGACVVLAGLLFYERILAIASVWIIDANYSHGFLILPMSIGLAYRELKDQKAPLQGETGIGMATIAAGIVVLMGTSISGVMIVDFLALAMVLRGSAVVIGGRAWASALTFPIFFLFFMFPLPLTWTNFASVWLQDWVSFISGRVLELFFVCHQQGNTIFLAGAAEPIYVAQECSGLRQLVSFVALATLVGYLSRKGPAFGLLMVLAAIPVAIISNVLRVLLMAVAIRYLGSQSISGWLHDIPALATLPIGLLLFFGLHRCLGGLFATHEAPAEGQA